MPAHAMYSLCTTKKKPWHNWQVVAGCGMAGGPHQPAMSDDAMSDDAKKKADDAKKADAKKENLVTRGVNGTNKYCSPPFSLAGDTP